jgi:hypothetical protein
MAKQQTETCIERERPRHSIEVIVKKGKVITVKKLSYHCNRPWRLIGV